jgi:signal peptidase I
MSSETDPFTASSASGGLQRTTRRRPLVALGQALCRLLWGVVLPALLTGLVLRYLVPPIGSGVAGFIARLGQGVPLLFGVGLFLLFSALAYYWQKRLSERPAFAAWFPVSTAPAVEGKTQRWWNGLVLALMIVAAACAAVLVRAVVRPFRIFSESMVPTLEPGDLVAGFARSRAPGARPPRRGDVVVFNGSVVGLKPSVALPDTLVKRVIGLPGDRIEMQKDSPIINGWRVPNCEVGEYLYVIPDTRGRGVHGRMYVEFLEDRAYLTVHAFGRPFQGVYVVQPGEAFVLGDNRGNSMDSRSYREGLGGGVPFTALEARVTSLLAGTQRSGDADLGRLLQPVDGLKVHSRIEGMIAPDLQPQIERCLQNRPTDTRPPPP